MKYKSSIGFLLNTLDFTNNSQTFTYFLFSNIKKSLQSIEGLGSVIDHYRNEGTARLKHAYEELKTNISNVKGKCKPLISPTQTNEKYETLKYDLANSSSSSQNDKNYGVTRSGNIYKKSEGIRKQWQKRYCVIEDGYMNIYHNQNLEGKVSISLLTSQVKNAPPEKDAKHFPFILIAANRQYWFCTESDIETLAWISVINNNKEVLLKQVIIKNENSSLNPPENNEILDFLKQQIQNTPGNEKCADCLVDNPDWFSTNLGILVCIECSGIHREMGVRVSRIRSMTIDLLKSWELILLSSIGNYSMNEILDPYPENHDSINKNSTMEERRNFLHDKYISKKFIDTTSLQTSINDITYEELLNYDISSIVYLYMIGYDFINSKNDPNNNSFLHIFIQKSPESYFSILEFIVQNITQSIDYQNSDGNTPLHIALSCRKLNYAKILLRISSDTNIANKNGLTPMELISNSTDSSFLFLRDHILNKRTNKLELDDNLLLPQFEQTSSSCLVSPDASPLLHNKGSLSRLNFKIPKESSTKQDSSKNSPNPIKKMFSRDFSDISLSIKNIPYDNTSSLNSDSTNLSTQLTTTESSTQNIKDSSSPQVTSQNSVKSKKKMDFSKNVQYLALVKKTPESSLCPFKQYDAILVKGFTSDGVVHASLVDKEEVSGEINEADIIVMKEKS